MLRSGFELVIPAWPPFGFVAVPDHPTVGLWHLQGRLVSDPAIYVDCWEAIDTRLSYPQPIEYTYLVHLGDVHRNISFHKDLSARPELLHHWHEYVDGEHGSEHQPMPMITLTWFLISAWQLILVPNLSVPGLLTDHSQPGPPDPW